MVLRVIPGFLLPPVVPVKTADLPASARTATPNQASIDDIMPKGQRSSARNSLTGHLLTPPPIIAVQALEVTAL